MLEIETASQGTTSRPSLVFQWDHLRSTSGSLAVRNHLRSNLEIISGRGSFTGKPTEVNFPSADWLSYLRTQLTVFVGGVCLQRSRKISSALFSRNNFKELQVKGNLFDCSQILTVASFVMI